MFPSGHNITRYLKLLCFLQDTISHNILSCKCFLQDTISHDAPKRHKLSVHVMSTVPGDEQKDTPDDAEVLTSPVEIPQVRNKTIKSLPLLVICFLDQPFLSCLYEFNLSINDLENVVNSIYRKIAIYVRKNLFASQT